MEDTKQEKAQSQKSTDELLDERKSDATDDATLRDIEKTRRSLDSENSYQGGTPSPDGAFDESKETGPIGTEG